jgi:hypothetical protein
MSPLKKTTIVPDGNPKEVLNKKILKMIVLRDNTKLAEFANELAIYPPNIERWVIWFKNPDENEIVKLFGNLDKDFNKIAGFSLSAKNEIANYILVNELIDILRVEEAYTDAGLPNYN